MSINSRLGVAPIITLSLLILLLPLQASARAEATAGAGNRAPVANTAPPRKAAQLAYVMMSDANSVAVIDQATHAVRATIAVEGVPHGGALTPDGRRLYMANMGGTRLSVVDTSAQRLLQTIDVGSISHHMATSADGRFLYVAAKELLQIDTATNTIVGAIELSEAPFDLQVAPDGRTLYVLNMGRTLSVVDLQSHTEVAVIPVGRSMMGHVAVSPDGSRLYVTDDRDNTLSVIDTTLLETRIQK